MTAEHIRAAEWKLDQHTQADAMKWIVASDDGQPTGFCQRSSLRNVEEEEDVFVNFFLSLITFKDELLKC